MLLVLLCDQRDMMVLLEILLVTYDEIMFKLFLSTEVAICLAIHENWLQSSKAEDDA